MNHLASLIVFPPKNKKIQPDNKIQDVFFAIFFTKNRAGLFGKIGELSPMRLGQRLQISELPRSLSFILSLSLRHTHSPLTDCLLPGFCTTCPLVKCKWLLLQNYGFLRIFTDYGFFCSCKKNGLDGEIRQTDTHRQTV